MLPILGKLKVLKKALPVLPYLAIVAIIAGAGMFVYNRGLHVAYERAAMTHERVIAELNRQFEEEREDRDAEWREEVSDLLQRVAMKEEQARRDRERERELEGAIRSLNLSLQEIQRDVYDSDVGTCRVSPEFDRVLHRARSAAITP